MALSENILNQVIAVEIGNVKSGYAYFIGGERSEIYTATNGYGLPEERVPTALLLNSDFSLHLFGAVAEEKYCDLELRGQQHTYRFFESKQMKLTSYDNSPSHNGADVKIDALVEEKDIYAIIVKYLYETCLEQIRSHGELKILDPFLIITVPGHYGEFEINAMHAAAVRAGIKDDNVNIVFEIDAAALYCTRQDLLVESTKIDKTLPERYRFVIVDLGGSKTQYCKYEISERSKFQPLSDVVCLPVGSETVTDAFMQKLEMMIVVKMATLKKTNFYDYNEIRKSFEDCKRSFDGSQRTNMIEMPPSFIQLKHKIEEHQTCSSFVLTADNKVIIKRETLLDVFDQSLNKIVSKLKVDMKGEDINTILFVGGFSQSLYVREFITKAIEPIECVLVNKADLAVLKGAAMIEKPFHRSAFSYGFILMEGITDEQTNTNSNNDKDNTQNRLFKKVISKNEIICTGQIWEERFTVSGTEKSEEIVLYKTTTDHMYFDENTKDVFKRVERTEVPSGRWQNEVTVRLRVDLLKSTPKFKLEAKSNGKSFCEKLMAFLPQSSN